MIALNLAAACLAFDGIIEDDRGFPISGALIEVVDPPTTGVRGEVAETAISGTAGIFHLDVPDSVHPDATLVVSFPGFPRAQWQWSEVEDGATMRLEPPRASFVASNRRAPDPWPAPPSEIPLDEWKVAPLAGCGPSCVDLVLESDGHHGTFLVRVAGDTEVGLLRCQVYFMDAKGSVKERRCRGRSAWSWIDQAWVRRFFTRPELEAEWLSPHQQVTQYIGACAGVVCHDIIRTWPEDHVLSAFLAEAYRAAGARRSWPYPTP